MAKISPARLAEYIVDKLESGASSASLARLLAAYLIENRQTRDAAHIMRAVETELNSRGITQVEITSAHEVSDTVKQELASLLKAKNPVFHETIDKKVIGGVMAKAGEQEIDLTVRGRLNRFKASIVAGKK